MKENQEVALKILGSSGVYQGDGFQINIQNEDDGCSFELALSADLAAEDAAEKGQAAWNVFFNFQDVLRKLGADIPKVDDAISIKPKLDLSLEDLKILTDKLNLLKNNALSASNQALFQGALDNLERLEAAPARVAPAPPPSDAAPPPPGAADFPPPPSDAAPPPPGAADFPPPPSDAAPPPPDAAPLKPAGKKKPPLPPKPVGKPADSMARVVADPGTVVITIPQKKVAPEKKTATTAQPPEVKGDRGLMSTSVMDPIRDLANQQQWTLDRQEATKSVPAHYKLSGFTNPSEKVTISENEIRGTGGAYEELALVTSRLPYSYVNISSPKGNQASLTASAEKMLAKGVLVNIKGGNLEAVLSNMHPNQQQTYCKLVASKVPGELPDEMVQAAKQLGQSGSGPSNAIKPS